MKILLLLLLTAAGVWSAAADGGVDSAFSAGNLFGNDVYALAVQPDGKILVGGDFFGGARTGIARLNPNGTLDASFDPGSGAFQVRSMALQPDGKVLIGGYFTTVNGTARVRIARLNADGSLDASFNPGTGAVTFNDSLVRALAVQPDGKILVGGNFDTFNDVPRRNLARLNADGSVDASFNAGTISSTGFSAQVSVIVVQPDGKILAGGLFNTVGGTATGSLARFNADGTLDTTFNVGGAGVGAGVWAIRLLAGGKILIGGNFTTVNGAARGKIARLNADGSLDASFAAAVDDSTATVFDFVVQSSGKPLIVGNFATVAGQSCNRLCRLNPDGGRDSSFRSGTDGPTGSVYAAALQRDDKVVIGGTFTAVRSVARSRIARIVQSRAADFDGDGRTDLSIWRPSVGEWWYSRSLDGLVPALRFGVAADRPVPADYTGDGASDIAFFRPSTGEWFILRSEDGSFYSLPFGAAGDIPAPGDYNGDGRAEPAVFRPSNSTWYAQRPNGTASIQQFGLTGDVPAPADYDGDGRTDLAIWRPATGEWWRSGTAAGLSVVTFGVATDRPAPADYTGDGRTDVAVFRPTTGEWFVLRSEDGSFYSLPFGAAGATAAPGDYDGDGRTDLAVFRPSEAVWYVRRSTGGFTIAGFGLGDDVPLPSRTIP